MCATCIRTLERMCDESKGSRQAWEKLADRACIYPLQVSHMVKASYPDTQIDVKDLYAMSKDKDDDGKPFVEILYSANPGGKKAMCHMGVHRYVYETEDNRDAAFARIEEIQARKGKAVVSKGSKNERRGSA